VIDQRIYPLAVHDHGKTGAGRIDKNTRPFHAFLPPHILIFYQLPPAIGSLPFLWHPIHIENIFS
jgi:hypothetical protein